MTITNCHISKFHKIRDITDPVNIMAIEIERKFLVKSDTWRHSVVSSTLMKQGYLGGGNSTVRVRMTDKTAFLTIKGKANGISRAEFEYEIPVSDAQAMLSDMTVGTSVEKIRYIVPAENDLFWEVDEYLNANYPLFTAEIELPSADTEFAIPEWLGEEVSDNKNYTNRSLSRAPYSTWVNGAPPAEEN